jgi:hypothetical protein
MKSLIFFSRFQTHHDWFSTLLIALLNAFVRKTKKKKRKKEKGRKEREERRKTISSV